MTLNFNQIKNLIIEKKNESSLVEIVIAYAALKQKFDNPESRSWYFNQGIESKSEALASSRNDFDQIRKYFNKATIDCLIAENKACELNLSHYNKNNMNSITRMHSEILKGNIAFNNELIRLKSKTKSLMPIDHYLDTPEDFLILID